jgi:membrane-associated phospholipid phosphatase
MDGGTGRSARDGTRRRLSARTITRDVLVVAGGVGTYFGVRGLTAGDAQVAREHAADVLAVEEALGLDVEADVQALLLDVDAVTTVANWVYIWGHWPVIVLTLLWLALHDRTVFLRLRNAMIASGLMGLCVYTTYPVAPPRLAGLGFVDTITEQSRSYRVLQPPAFVNQYAAMPSLHVGWDLLVGMALVAAAGSLALRTVGRTMPVLMAAATVITANHYVLDVVVGVAFGLAGWAVALRLERRRAGARPLTDGLPARVPGRLRSELPPPPARPLEGRPTPVLPGQRRPQEDAPQAGPRQPIGCPRQAP